MKIRQAFKIVNAPWRYSRNQVKKAFTVAMRFRYDNDDLFFWYVAYDQHYLKNKKKITQTKEKWARIEQGIETPLTARMEDNE